jgi:hypothetical protein
VTLIIIKSGAGRGYKEMIRNVRRIHHSDDDHFVFLGVVHLSIDRRVRQPQHIYQVRRIVLSQKISPRHQKHIRVITHIRYFVL